MDSQSAVVIQNLANKLGTTSEYLWAVLIKQAPISGTVDLILYALTVAVIVVALGQCCATLALQRVHRQA